MASRNPRTSEAAQRSTEPPPKSKLLKTCQAIFSKELTEPEADFWMQMMEEMTDASLAWAFENWNRNGSFFPKPHEIRALVESYELSRATHFRPCKKCNEGWLIVPDPAANALYQTKNQKRVMRCECWTNWRMGIEKLPAVTDPCSDECRSRHGHGYHATDIWWLYRTYIAKQGELQRNPNKAELLAMFDELDRLRGRPPVWRKT